MCLRGVAYGDGTFVAVGNFSPILTSTDGTEWLVRIPGATGLFAVGFGDGVFVAVGLGGIILTSP